MELFLAVLAVCSWIQCVKTRFGCLSSLFSIDPKCCLNVTTSVFRSWIVIFPSQIDIEPTFVLLVWWAEIASQLFPAALVMRASILYVETICGSLCCIFTATQSVGGTSPRLPFSHESPFFRARLILNFRSFCYFVSWNCDYYNTTISASLAHVRVDCSLRIVLLTSHCRPQV